MIRYLPKNLTAVEAADRASNIAHVECEKAERIESYLSVINCRDIDNLPYNVAVRLSLNKEYEHTLMVLTQKVLSDLPGDDLPRRNFTMCFQAFMPVFGVYKPELIKNFRADNMFVFPLEGDKRDKILSWVFSHAGTPYGLLTDIPRAGAEIVNSWFSKLFKKNKRAVKKEINKGDTKTMICSEAAMRVMYDCVFDDIFKNHLIEVVPSNFDAVNPADIQNVFELCERSKVKGVYLKANKDYRREIQGIDDPEIAWPTQSFFNTWEETKT